jgi:ribosomal protein L20A (L18A)
MRIVWTAIILFISVSAFAGESRPGYCPLPKEIKKAKVDGFWTGEWVPAKQKFCLALTSVKNGEVEAIYSWDDFDSKNRAGWKKIKTSNVSEKEMIFDWSCPEGHPIQLKMNFQDNKAHFSHGTFRPHDAEIKRIE